MPDTHPLRTAYARNHPAELAAYLAAQPYDVLMATLNGLPADAGVGVIARLPHALALRVLATQSDDTVARWLAQANLDDALSVVLHLHEDRRRAVLATLPVRHMRRSIERLVIYPRKTVGALVDPTVVRLTTGTTLDIAIATLRAGDCEQQERIWVIDDDSRYVGILDSSRALLARSRRFTVGELASFLEPLRAETGLAAARDVREWLKHPELPVVDHHNHLLGGLSRTRLMDALQQDSPIDRGIMDTIAALANQYFRVMSICLDDLLGPRNPR